MKLNIQWKFFINSEVAFIGLILLRLIIIYVKMYKDIGEQQKVDFQTLKRGTALVKSTLIQLFTAVHFRTFFTV